MNCMCWKVKADTFLLFTLFDGSREGMKEEKQSKNSGGDKIKLKLRLDHQVSYGEHVAVLGSAKEFGSWKKEVLMKWTENGWVSYMELKGPEETVEYKFVIVGQDKKLIWENGDNRVLKITENGSFSVVCKWDRTKEELKLLPLEGDEVEEKGSGNGKVVTSGVEEAVTTSAFVDQWQGKNVSFVRSKDHFDGEKKIQWDTSGLEGISLKFVDGDRSARNWWRKV